MSVLVESNPNLVQMHRPYKAGLFVNRQDEIKEIHEKIRLVQAEQTVSYPVINYWGIEGIGKSWLLHYLNDKLSYSQNNNKKFPTLTTLLDFREIKGGDVLDRFAKKLSAQILDQLSTHVPNKLRPRLEAVRKSGNLEDLAEIIVALSENFTPLILLDHADMLHPLDLWDEIEKFFFEPIVTTGRVLIVVAGRRQIPRWRRFEVRRRVMESDKSQIRPFDKRDVMRQVENRNISIPAELLYPYTAGNPHIVDTFVKHIKLWTKKSEKKNIDEKWIEKHNKGFLRVLQLSEEELIKDIPDRLKQPLIAISPLRFFRLEAMRKMLSSKNEKFTSEPEGYFLQLVRDLDQDTEIVWWDREKRAYVTSEVVRKLVNQKKLLEAPPDYLRSHDQAFKMYRQWAEDSPKTSDEFIIEMLFHQASICQATKDISCLRSKTNEILDFARANNLSTDRRLAFFNQIKGDNEILDLFPNGEREDLLRKVESMLNS